MAQAAEDAAIIAELEDINRHLIAIYGKLDDTTSIIDDDICTLGDELDNFRADSTDNQMTIISYLNYFLIVAFVVFGIIFVFKMAKWIENLICDR